MGALQVEEILLRCAVMAEDGSRYGFPQRTEVTKFGSCHGTYKEAQQRGMKLIAGCLNANPTPLDERPPMRHISSVPGALPAPDSTPAAPKSSCFPGFGRLFTRKRSEVPAPGRAIAASSSPSIFAGVEAMAGSLPARSRVRSVSDSDQAPRHAGAPARP